jgi:hypothetical protein
MSPLALAPFPLAIFVLLSPLASAAVPLAPSTRAGSPALIVVSEQTIPETYWLPQPPKLDRQTILGELKRGFEFPGAELSNPKPILMVRTK